MKYLLSSICLLFVFVSCRKDPSIPAPNKPNQHVYLENTPGSYFVYHWFEIDSLGNETTKNYIDTVTVQNDTIINGNSYFYLKGSYFVFDEKNVFYRDSIGFVVDETGLILCSYLPTDTVRVIESDPLSNYFINKNSNDNKFLLPSGIIKGKTFEPKLRFVFDHQQHSYMNNEPISACDSVWVWHKKYADGYGEVSSQIAYITGLKTECKYFERRLVFFDIK